MVKSITFPLEGNGYLYEKVEPPVEPNKNSREYWKRTRSSMFTESVFDKEAFKADMASYENEMKAYKLIEGSYKLPCAENLIGRKFEFEDGKINLIFGPNASGKTTILKAIAGGCGIKDGFTTLLEPLQMKYSLFDTLTKEVVEKTYEEQAKNTNVLEWSGNPVYYDNFSDKLKTSYGHIGGLTGGILDGLGDEMVFRLASNKSSSGQVMGFLINRLMNISSTKRSLKDILQSQLDKYARSNDTWQICGKLQEEIFAKLPDYATPMPITILLDEIDKSLDIKSTHLLYANVLPNLVKQTGCQVIVISHSPIVLSEGIFSNPMYNFVSIDETYTKEMKELLGAISF